MLEEIRELYKVEESIRGKPAHIQCKTDEPFEVLLNRFDAAIGVAVQTGQAIDEINNTPR